MRSDLNISTCPMNIRKLTAWRAAALVIPAMLAAQAVAQPALYGVELNGDLIRINPYSGVGALVASSGYTCNAATRDNAGRILLGGGAGAAADQIIELDPATGTGAVLLTTTGRPAGYGIRGMAMSPAGVLFVVLSDSSGTVVDELARINMATGVYTIIGPTGRTDLQDLAFAGSGVLYGMGISGGGTLCTINSVTGAAAAVGGGALAGDTQALTFYPGIGLLAGRANLLRVSPAGASVLVGATGFSDIRGMAAIPGCYANCDHSTVAPILNVNDFVCFLTRAAAGDPYANCDHSTGLPSITVNDYVCYMNAYAVGCT